MILTDADGDGFAQEIVLSRGFCYPQRQGPESDPENKIYGPFSYQVNNFCSTRPVGSIAVFKYNKNSEKMVEISPKYKNVSSKENKQPACCPHGSESTTNDCHVKSMASADFDGDRLADQLMLYSSKMTFYFSKDRKKGILPTSSEQIGQVIHFPFYCGGAEGVRVVDLDNDGIEEILVMCRITSTFLVYTRGKNHRQWTLNNGCNNSYGTGDLSDRKRATFSFAQFQGFCSTGGTDKTKKKVCKGFKKNGKEKITFSGICLVDLNNDGYLDAVTTYDFGFTRFMLNTPRRNNEFISFKLIGDKTSVNEYGIGSTVVLFGQKGSKIVTQLREMSTYQHTTDKYGCKEDRIIFGLGDDIIPMKVEIRWPNGIVQTESLKNWTFRKYHEPIKLKYINPQ